MADVVKLPKRRGERAKPVTAGQIMPIDHILGDQAAVQRGWADKLREALDSGNLDAADVVALVKQLEATARDLDGVSAWLVANWPRQ